MVKTLQQLELRESEHYTPDWWDVNYYADKDFVLQVTVTLTFDLLTPKSKGIIYG